MRGNRLRWGALGWVLTLQFFVVETIAQLGFHGPYSRADNVISDLGALQSSTHRLMNASFVAQAALILAGVLFLLPAIRGTAARVAQLLLTVAAVGVLLVGVFPEDGGQHTFHVVGAVMYFVGSALGLIALAYALRPRSELLGTALAVLGLVGAAGTVFFFDAITEYLGEGGTERVAGYVLPVGLAISGIALWRTAGRDGALPDVGEDRPSRGALRAQARAERVERERARDQALEEAAARRAAGRIQSAAQQPPQPAGDLAGDRAPDTGSDDELDPEDPWAPPSRR